MLFVNKVFCAEGGFITKILILTNFFPQKNNSTGGIFITKRLQQYKNLGIQFAAIPVLYGNKRLGTLVGKFIGKKFSEPASEAYGIDYFVLDHKGLKELFLQLIVRIFDKGMSYTVNRKYFEYLCLVIAKKLDVSSFDIIHAHGISKLPAGFLAKILAEKYNKPYVVTLHGSDDEHFMKLRKYYVEVLEQADAVISVSDALVQTAKELGYSGKNAFVVPNGYDPEIFKPAEKVQVRKNLGIFKEGYKYVGFIGGLQEVKRADKLIDIFGILKKGIQNIQFIVVGDGPLRDMLQSEARRSNLDVIFTGRLEPEGVAKFMNALDVMILPSRKEGWGCVVIEAQACGTCVVGSSNGGIPEAIGFPECVVEEGENFEERFAKKVAEVLSSGYDRDTLINRAKAYTWESAVLKEKNVYEKVLERRKGRQSSSSIG